ncbi:MAG: undecaprenyldiphospho-muramoylpentapeptide beta-N-acetylglucosaminyltransferase [Bacteroidales bacterium]|nr:undecaprenyldiphospho-muramoylpentapeptide beta-N-acetylglucosaminyltransferase [Bacteroidales bacterium]
MNKISNNKVIISGGGTGGHVFPAIAIANALKDIEQSIQILFVGAKGKLEMNKVPDAGYNIIGLPIAGFQRRLTIKNITFFFKLFYSIIKSHKILKTFKPGVVIGVGGYASGPLLYVASKKKIPVIIQEQNSYAGVTNKILAKKAEKICVAYENMEKYFPKDKIILTGNPVRKDLFKEINKDEAIKYFSLDKNKKTLLVLGGSLGARTINQSMINDLKIFEQENIQVIWQTGKYFYQNACDEVKSSNYKNVIVHEFITRMDLVYNIADLIISRAGAGTISELCLLAKPTILVPSPNVAENHQMKNALALADNNAAIMIKDTDAKTELINKAVEVISNNDMLNSLSENIYKMAIKDSDKLIANEIFKILNKT